MRMADFQFFHDFIFTNGSAKTWSNRFLKGLNFANDQHLQNLWNLSNSKNHLDGNHSLGTWICRCSHTSMYIYTYTLLHVDGKADTDTNKRMDTYRHTHTHAHIQMHTHTHIH